MSPAINQKSETPSCLTPSRSWSQAWCFRSGTRKSGIGQLWVVSLRTWINTHLWDSFQLHLSTLILIWAFRTELTSPSRHFMNEIWKDCSPFLNPAFGAMWLGFSHDAGCRFSYYYSIIHTRHAGQPAHTATVWQPSATLSTHFTNAITKHMAIARAF